MKSIKKEVLQIRVSELEKSVIKDKADLLGLSITEYVKFCCIFSNATAEFMKDMFANIAST